MTKLKAGKSEVQARKPVRLDPIPEPPLEKRIHITVDVTVHRVIYALAALILAAGAVIF